MKHWGESYKKSQWSFEKHGDLWNTKEKVRKKNIVIFWKTWRFQNHNGESCIKRRLWSFEKYGDLWNTGEKDINKKLMIFWKDGVIWNKGDNVIKKR